MLVKLTSTATTSIQKEPPRQVLALPGLRPFDMAAVFNHLMDETAWRMSLFKLGMDVTFFTFKPQFLTDTQAARKKEVYLRLRKGEKMKFRRHGKTDKTTMITITGDEIIADIIRNNMALLSIAISPHG